MILAFQATVTIQVLRLKNASPFINVVRRIYVDINSTHKV